MSRMYDASRPPTHPPAWEICAFYIGGDTPHIWTTTEVAKQPARYRLPIWVRSNPQGAPQGHTEGLAAVAWLTSHGVPKGSAVCIDFEIAVDPRYLAAFDGVVTAAGYKTVSYGSRSFITRLPIPSGGRWSAEWDGKRHVASGDVATQYADDRMLGTDYDASEVVNSLVLWDTESHPVPPPKAPSAIDKILAKAISQVGYHSSGDSKYGDWYAARVKDAAFKTADWCDMFISWCGFMTGLDAYIGVFAYVPSHHNWFTNKGEWHAGTKGVARGDILVMDFVGGNGGSHIGFVESVQTDGIHTIEGNTGGGSGSVLRRVRTTNILGYGRPAYPGGTPTSPPPVNDWLDKLMATLPNMKMGNTGPNVETVQGLCNARMRRGIDNLLKIDGVFGSATLAAVKTAQSRYGAASDGIVGPQTWGLLITARHV